MKQARDTTGTASRLRVAYWARRCGARHGGRTDQGVDLPTNPATGAMQENALVLGADFQQRARLLGVAAFHVTQQDDRSLAGWQPVDHRLNMIPQTRRPLTIRSGFRSIPELQEPLACDRRV